MAASPELPAGVVTFLLTDVEASTRMWQSSPAAAEAMARQAAIIRTAVAENGGVLPADQGEGDSTLAAFGRPTDALGAALTAQRALIAEPWPDGAQVRVRMAIHTGEAPLRDGGNYGGTTVARTARLRALARGGQVLVSGATAEIAGDAIPAGAILVALDVVSLPDFDRPERVHQLCHADLPVVFGPLRGTRTRLPGWATPLVGRTQERSELTALLAAGPLVTITGAGGSGKTRLAHAVAEDLASRHPDGVVWVELARLAAGGQVAGTVAAACGVSEVPGLSARDVVVRHLAETELLLVLDNCEHVLEDVAALADAVTRMGVGVRILATSREPLGVAGEVTWRIPSLAVPDAAEREPERLATIDAVRLFTDRVRAARPDFQLDRTTSPAVVRIVRRLDGIPLALELAAARVRTMSIDRLADGLDDRFRLLTGGARTAMARQRTLLASVQWSVDLLDDEERTLFRRLGVFAAPFTLEAAEAVAADDGLDRYGVLDVLGRLVDKSLVLHTGDRYWLLETLRHFALEQAAANDELTALRSRHLAWFRRRARGWGLEGICPRWRRRRSSMPKLRT